MVTVIESNKLSRLFGETVAVDGVSLKVEKGALFGLLGPNGSGKTTMIRMLTGQIMPSFGSATVLGIDVSSDPLSVRKAIGIIPEQETPPSFLTSEEYLSFVGSVRNIPDIKEKAAFWFDYLEFGDKRNVLCKDLSRGTRQKLMFAQAFIHQPELALIDEPLINFDPVMQQKVKKFLSDYVKDGRTILISTHILEIAGEICSDIAVLHKGKLLHLGSMKDLAEEKQDLSGFFLSLVGQAGYV